MPELQAHQRDHRMALPRWSRTETLMTKTSVHFRAEPTRQFGTLTVLVNLETIQIADSDEGMHVVMDLDEAKIMRDILNRCVPADEPDEGHYIEVGELVDIEDGMGTVICDWNAEREKLPAGTIIFARLYTQQELDAARQRA